MMDILVLFVCYIIFVFIVGFLRYYVLEWAFNAIDRCPTWLLKLLAFLFVCFVCFLIKKYDLLWFFILSIIFFILVAD